MNKTSDVASPAFTASTFIKENNIGPAVRSPVTDIEIAGDILDSLKLNWQVPEEQVRVTVKNGCVTLDGELAWNYQKAAVNRIVSNLSAVKNVINNIIIKSAATDQVEKMDIEQALQRNWTVPHRAISVTVCGNSVMLCGTVNSLYQREEAERIAWKAAGVSAVDNKLQIEFDYPPAG